MAETPGRCHPETQKVGGTKEKPRVVLGRLYRSLSPKELKREFLCEWRKHQNVPETGNKKETPCKDVYLKTAPRTPLSWVKLEYTLHMALCSYSCVGVAAMARNRNKRRSPTLFLPHPGNPAQVCSPRCLYTTETQKRNSLMNLRGLFDPKL